MPKTVRAVELIKSFPTGRHPSDLEEHPQQASSVVATCFNANFLL
jgi:hypothetical protein